ncbi:hypothetical protein BpHYR1_029613 [Brachionus plicatilis]|uniref:Uncharacterized protein n=1 Tax=Brachionus plicatilis TaxID=10195 RepID=A0A3M7R1W1_BRAPC|nr:hypothetical protein BpHYR1_029613 [Brachionus plicatilis]
MGHEKNTSKNDVKPQPVSFGLLTTFSLGTVSKVTKSFSCFSLAGFGLPNPSASFCLAYLITFCKLTGFLPLTLHSISR